MPKKPKQLITMETVTGCRWPHGEPGADDFHFCNADRVRGRSYCQEHMERAYMKRPKKKRGGFFKIFGVGI